MTIANTIRITATAFVLFASLCFASDRKLPSVAIMNLEVQSLDKETVRSITDAVADEVIRSRKARVMERSQMEQILKEQGFQQSGACDGTECAVAVGKLLSIDQMIVGSIGRIGESYTISLRLVNTSTGELINGSRAMQRGAIDEIVATSVPKIVSQLFAVDPEDRNKQRTFAPKVQSSSVVADTTRQTKTVAPKPTANRDGPQAGNSNYTTIGRLVLGATAVGATVGALLIENRYQNEVSDYRSRGITAPVKRSEATARGEIALSTIAILSAVTLGYTFAF